jgi:hypothetical protein
VLFEDIMNNGTKVVKDIYTFLGVNPKYKPSMATKRVHETRLINNNILIKNFRKLADLLKKLGLGALIKIVRKTGAKSLIFKMNTMDNNLAFPAMEDKTRKDLLKYFEKENKQLGALFNLDLSHWSI